MLTRLTLSTFVLSCIWGLNPQSAFSQPGNELEQLQAQMRLMQSKINSLNQQNDNPFGGQVDDRVRSVGRKRVAPPPRVDDDTLSIRFYDLSDIFSVSPQYPAETPVTLRRQKAELFSRNGNANVSGGGFGGGGGGVFRFPPGPIGPQQQAQTMNLDAARVSVQSLIEAIRETVEPDEWVDEGGEATVKVLGNTLLISAKDSMHKQIANLINLFRDHWGKLKTVSIQAFWIRADADDIRKMLGQTDDSIVIGTVPKNQWEPFFNKAKEEGRIAYSASLSGHNGQTLHTLSGRQKQVVVDVEEVTSSVIDKEGNENSSVAALRPIRASLQQGAAIQVSPLATRGGNFVVLDLHTRVNEEVPKEEGESKSPPEMVAHGPQGERLSVPLDVIDVVAYRLSTTLRCPKDQMMLAGGMTFDGSSEKNSELYLFVRAGVHTIQEDKIVKEELPKSR